MTFFKFRDILRTCTLPAVLVTSSDLSLSGNEAEEDEDVGMGSPCSSRKVSHEWLREQ